MSHLYESEMETFVLLHETIEEDGFGGVKSTLTEGTQFQAAAVYDQSTQAVAAEAQGVKSMWTFTVDKRVRIVFHQAFKRISDNMTFRCTSKDFKETPKAASFKMRQFRAEEWEPEK